MFFLVAGYYAKTSDTPPIDYAVSKFLYLLLMFPATIPAYLYLAFIDAHRKYYHPVTIISFIVVLAGSLWAGIGMVYESAESIADNLQLFWVFLLWIWLYFIPVYLAVHHYVGKSRQLEPFIKKRKRHAR